MAAGVRRIRANYSQEPTLLTDEFDLFADEKLASGVVEKTVRNYRESLKRFIGFLESQGIRADTSAITQSRIESYSRQLQNQKLSNSTINHYLRDVRAFAYWYQDKSGIDPFVVKILPKGQKKPKVYTDSDLVAILHKPKKNASFVEHRTWIITNFVFATAARIGTICALQMKDIDFVSDEVHFRRTKNKKEQTLPISPKLKTALKEYIRTWRRDAEAEEYLFCSVTGGKLSEDALKHAFHDYSTARGSSKTSMHALRHTFVKHYVQAHGDPFRLQAILNHSTLDMTKEYLDLFGTDLHDGYNEFNPLERFRSSNRTQSIMRYQPDRNMKKAGGRRRIDG